VGHYGGSYKVTYDLYKKFGDTRLLDTPICGEILHTLPTLSHTRSAS
jgi:pyruvate/2-oxoglutarate/acetoin dehydrogenase E1 component